MCFVYASDGPEFFRERQVRAARRPRTCCDCKQTIHAGEPYRESTGRWEGTFQTFATCGRCQTLRAAIGAVEADEGCDANESEPGFGALFTDVEDWDHYAEEFLRRGLTEAYVLVPAPSHKDLYAHRLVDDYPNAWDHKTFNLPPPELYDELGGEGG
jgi:hypothetical protein